MEKNKIKGKGLAVTALVLAILAVLLGCLMIWVAIMNKFGSNILPLIGWYSGFCFLSFILSFIGFQRMKKSVGKSGIGTAGILFSVLMIALSGVIFIITLQVKPVENPQLNDKDFDKQKAGMDSILNMVKSVNDSSAKDTSGKK